LVQIKVIITFTDDDHLEDDDEWDDDEDDGYTTIPFTEEKEKEEDVKDDVQEKINPNDADPYISYSDMQSLSESTYSLRFSNHDLNELTQPTSDLYNTLDQSR